MWWECSVCGSTFERLRRPVSCRECGTAGGIFSPVEPDEVAPAYNDERRGAWLEAGMLRAHQYASELAALP